MRIHRSLTLATLVALASAVSAAPKMQVDEETFVFGITPQHAKVSHRFVIKSVGEDTLQIIRVIPGCGCTQMPLEKDKIAPGDSTTVEIIFNTGSYTGNIGKSPSIQTNENETMKSFGISSAVTTRPDSTYPLVLVPYKLALNQSDSRDQTEKSFKIVNHADKPLRLRPIGIQADFFELNLPEQIGAGQTVEASVTLTPKAIATAFEKSITIEVDDENSTRFTMPIKRELRNAASVVPASGSGH